jgi:hypothetical protein
MYLERVVDCCGAFVGRDGGGCAQGDHQLISQVKRFGGNHVSDVHIDGIAGSSDGERGWPGEGTWGGDLELDLDSRKCPLGVSRIIEPR